MAIKSAFYTLFYRGINGYNNNKPLITKNNVYYFDNFMKSRFMMFVDGYTEGEVEKLFGLKASTLRKRRLNGEGPSYSKDGERVLYSRRKVEQYLESRRQKTHDQP